MKNVFEKFNCAKISLKMWGMRKKVSFAKILPAPPPFSRKMRK